jgi:hypothetical protein
LYPIAQHKFSLTFLEFAQTHYSHWQRSLAETQPILWKSPERIELVPYFADSIPVFKPSILSLELDHVVQVCFLSKFVNLGTGSEQLRELIQFYYLKFYFFGTNGGSEKSKV